MIKGLFSPVSDPIPRSTIRVDPPRLEEGAETTAPATFPERDCNALPPRAAVKTSPFTSCVA